METQAYAYVETIFKTIRTSKKLNKYYVTRQNAEIEIHGERRNVKM